MIGTQIPSDWVDRMMELYCDWRTGCMEVQAAYERFLHSSSSDRTAAFAAYMAALDREESASESYAAQVRLIESRCAVVTPRARWRQTRRPS